MNNNRDKLRAICHSLKMRDWGGLDPMALADLNSRLRKLPSAEAISRMSNADLEALRKRLDRLIFDIDRHDNPRSKSRAVRYQSDTNLPPRREPLVAKNWYRVVKLATKDHSFVKTASSSLNRFSGEVDYDGAPKLIRRKIQVSKEVQICPNCNQEILEKHSYCPDWEGHPDIFVHSDCGKSYRTWMTKEQKQELADFERRFLGKKGPHLAECPSCHYRFDYVSVPEIKMGAVACPRCQNPVTQANCLES